MKPIIIAISLQLCFFVPKAQTDLKKKIVDSTCACLSEIPDLDKKSQNELQVAVGQCMMKKSMTDFMALAQERNIEMSDMDGMQKLAMEVGMDLSKSDCKAMNNLMMKMAQSKSNATDAPTENTAKGKVQSVEIKDFVYITILSNATLTQMVWSDNVTNGNDYVKDLNKLKNKSLEFSYINKQVYSIKAKAYINVKMITGVK